MAINERLQRNKLTQEYFTPDNYVKHMINEAPVEFFKTLMPYREQCCGTGNISIQVIEKFLQYHTIEDILSVIQLSDILEENCIETIKRICPNSIIQVIDVPDEYKISGLIKMFKIDGNLVKWIVQSDTSKFFWWERNRTFDKLFV